MSTKVDTSLLDLLTFIEKENTNPKVLMPVINALLKTIKVKKNRRIIMPDKNLNKLFDIKRIGYKALVKIQEADEQGMYTAKVIKILSGDTKVTEGTSITISKRELQLIGRPSASVE